MELVSKIVCISHVMTWHNRQLHTAMEMLNYFYFVIVVGGGILLLLMPFALAACGKWISTIFAIVFQLLIAFVVKEWACSFNLDAGYSSKSWLAFLALAGVFTLFMISALDLTISWSECGFLVLLMFTAVLIASICLWDIVNWVELNRVVRAPIDPKEKGVVGYKIFDQNWRCRDIQYHLGERISREQVPSLCVRGFHFCLNAKSCAVYCDYQDSPEGCKFAMVEAVGEIRFDGGKAATNVLNIVKELSCEEFMELCKETQVVLPHPRNRDGDILKFANGVTRMWFKLELTPLLSR